MATFGTAIMRGESRAFRVEGDRVAMLPALDVGQLLQDPALQRASGDLRPMPPIECLLPPISRPEKILCVGLNYREHALEVGKPLPTYPTLFAKYPSALVGAGEPIQMPAIEVSSKVDWEAELAVVIGADVYRADAAAASDAIFGYTVMNDVSMRDWQNRTDEWLQGKNFERTTPVGPVVVTADVLDVAGGLSLETRVGDRTVQSGNTRDLIFTPADIVSYISSFMSLRPGDMIATGTPAGVGVSRRPQEFLDDGDLLVTRISGIGELRNRCVREAVR